MLQKSLLFSVLLGAELIAAQTPVTPAGDEHPKITTYTCTKAGGCKKKTSYIVIDEDLHPKYQKNNPSLSCGSWGAPPNATVCPDAATCAANCVIESLSTADYAARGVRTEGTALHLDMLKDSDLSSLSPRTYLLDENREEYDMLKLTGQELAFTVDSSKLPCGMNGALYLSEMHPKGGPSPLNQVGAKRGGGYCDAQCFTFPFLEGVGNVEGKGACCNEMDIYEHNSRSNAFVPHPCNITGVYGGNAAESAFEGVCDEWGCGYNPYGINQPNFFGRGSGFAVDTTRPYQVVTSFPADKNGKLDRIERRYVQDGKVIQNAVVNVEGREKKNYIDDEFCEENPGGTRRFTELGGNVAMGEAMSRGMVLAMSIWWDAGGYMDWLDGVKSNAGPCDATEGSPENIRKVQPDTSLTFSDIKVGEIGSTYAKGCAADNCLRAMRATTVKGRLEASQAFCKTFTKSFIEDVSVVPAFAASACAGDVIARASSACSCLPAPTST